MWLFLAVANVSTWKVTKGKLIYFIHIAMANDFMYGVPPRHTHGENRVKYSSFAYSCLCDILKLGGSQVF